MRNILTLSGAALLIGVTSCAALMTGVAPAFAFSRNGSFTGPRGTSNFYGSGSCSGGSCSHSAGGTGPAGRSWSRQGATSCANGVCSSSGNGTGPGGGAYSRSSSFSR